LTSASVIKRVPRLIAGLSLFLYLSCAPAFSAHPKIFIQSSAHIEVLYYSTAHEYLVTHLIRSYENALNFENNLFHYTPSQKLSVLLEDFGDYGHGAAGTVPSNFIDVGIAPFSYTYETLPANERMTWIMNHESIHIVMGDNSNSVDRRFRSLFFGKVVPTDEDPVSIFYSSLTSPRHYSTRWFHEGIATFMETWMAGGLGRAIGGWDEMVFRTMVRDDAYIYDVVGLESEGTSADFQSGANSYLYGTRFMTWLAYAYGPDKLLQWITRGENTKRYFASRFKQVYGIGMNDAWKMWIADERKFQEANLAEIRKYPVSVPQRLTAQTLGSVSRAYFDPEDNVIYAGIRYPAHLASVAAIHVDTGKIDELKVIKGPGLYYVTSLAWDAHGRKLFYTTDNNDLRDLNVYDVETHQSQRLQTDIRTGDLAFDAADGSLWGVRHNNGLSSLVEFPAPYKDGKAVHEFDYGTDVFDIDISPDGQFLTGAISDVSGRQKLVRFRVDDLRKNDNSFETLYDFEYNSPGNFVYSPDGRYLYGSSYYTGASNLFRYNFETKKMDVISNAETGLFRPLPLADGSLIAFEYTSKGFIPARVPTKALEDVSAVKYFGQATLNKYPELKAWKLPPPSSVNSENLITRAGIYKPLQNIQLISAYPIVQGYLNTVAVGMRAEFADRLRVAGVSVDASYSPDPNLPSDERAHVSFDAHLWDWKLTGYYNYADFYDLFGPTKLSRKGESLKLAHSQYLIYDTPRTLSLDWSVAGYSDLNALPEYQNVSTNNIGNLLDANIGLKYSNLVRAQGAVDDEQGTTWGLHSRLYYTHGAFPSAWGTYDHGFLLPRNSAFWVRTSAGKSFGDINSPFASFYFGAFGNNYIDHLSIDRYRDFYSFPGVSIDAIGARSFGKLLGEYNLPPKHFREFGSTWLYVNWARLTFFSSDLLTNFTSTPSRTNYINLGAQLDLRLVLFTYLSSTFSSGYAAAESNGHITTEYMFSLKIL
jgi:hypothetical protein